MKIFISWSGKRSKAVGELLDEWLRCVIQAAQPWMSSKDIDRGSLWFSEINDQLKDTGIGIICITTSNLNKPWILFEAGALAKGLSSNRVCTFLIDLNPSDISDPLAQFNHTLPNKESMCSLIRTLNNSLGEKRLGDKIIDSVFETYWPQFQVKFNQIILDTVDDVVEVKRDEEDILSELLYMTRRLDKRIRNVESNIERSSARGSELQFIDNDRYVINRFSESDIIMDNTRNIDDMQDNFKYRFITFDKDNKNIKTENNEYRDEDFKNKVVKKR